MLTSNGGMKEKQASVCIRLGIIAILNIFIWDFLFCYVNFKWRHERKTSDCVIRDHSHIEHFHFHMGIFILIRLLHREASPSELCISFFAEGSH